MDCMDSSNLKSPPDDAASKSTLPTSFRNPSKLFYQGNTVRRSIISAYWAVIILALPLWWYTTSIERLSLPSLRVSYYTQKELRIPINICLSTSVPELGKQLQVALSDRISKTQMPWGSLDVHVSAELGCGEPSEQNSYVIGSSEHRFIRGRRLFFPLHQPNSISYIADVLSSLLIPYSPVHAQEYRVVQFSPRYRLAFNLLNEDAAAGDGILNWDIEAAIRENIYPIIHSLSSLHNFTIESQVQFHAPLAFDPRLLEDRLYGLTHEDLSVFVNSAEWTLSSSVSNDPVLHFLLFIPSTSHRPLKIMNVDGTPSTSNAFLLQQWGGIVLHTQPGENGKMTLSEPALHHVFSTFSSQLLTLLGIPSLPDGLERDTFDTKSLLSAWQLDALLRRRAFENAKRSQDTLGSIVKLVDQIENMPVGESVKGDVQDSLDSLSKMYESSSRSLSEAFKHSAEAFDLASRAFFNPGMLALLYFPAEHKYAVYTPLFASAVIPLFVAALREVLAWRRQRKMSKP